MSMMSTSEALRANLEYMSWSSTGREKESSSSMRRPWGQMLDPQALSRPRSVGESLRRLRDNLCYFRVNMAMTVLLGVFLSLLWHPFSLLVMVASVAAWLWLFFLREHEKPLVVLGRPIDDLLVLSMLAPLTLLFLLLTSPAFNVLLSLNASLALLLLYSIFRRTDDLFLSDPSALV